ncbi:hypothetical protein ABK040_012128 [Willaertia magna]
MSALVGEEISYTAYVDPFGNGERLNGDDAVANAVLEQMVKVYNIPRTSYTGSLTQLQGMLSLIREVCIVVDNSVCKDPKDGLIQVTRVFTIELNKKTTAIGVDDSVLVALRMNDKVNGKILLVSELALNAIKRLINKRYEESQPTYYVTNTSSRNNYRRVDYSSNDSSEAWGYLIMGCCCFIPCPPIGLLLCIIGFAKF